MRKLLIALLMGAMLLPSELSAKNYESEKLMPLPNFPVMAPARFYVSAGINSETGEFTIWSNYDIDSMHVTITQGNVVLDEFTQAQTAGVPTVYGFDGYDEGEYLLTIEDSNGVIVQYVITIWDD